MKKIFNVFYRFSDKNGIKQNAVWEYSGNCSTLPRDISSAFWNFVRNSDLKKSEVVVDFLGTGLL